jgi:hypothetical protein
MDSVERWMGRCRPVRAAAAVAFACSVAACSSVANMMPDVGEFRLPDRSVFVPTTTNNFGLPISPTAPVSAADLVNGQGQCAAPAAAATTRGVSLDMTECEVVSVLGQPQSIEAPQAAANINQRRVVLTYRSGERPGIYEFNGGRLSGIERVDAPPTPPAVAKKPPKKKQQPAA